MERSGLVIDRVTTRKKTSAADGHEPRHQGDADPERVGGLGVGLVQRLDDLEGPVDLAVVPVFHLRARGVLAVGIAPELLRLRGGAVAQQAVLREADRTKIADGVALGSISWYSSRLPAAKAFKARVSTASGSFLGLRGWIFGTRNS